MEGFLPVDPHFATRACHEGQEPEQWTSMAVVPPISMSTTFKQDGPAEHRVRGRGREATFKQDGPAEHRVRRRGREATFKQDGPAEHRMRGRGREGGREGGRPSSNRTARRNIG